MIGVACVQRSQAWREARCGYLTASRAHDILARVRQQQESLTRRQYLRQLVCEQLTGIPLPARVQLVIVRLWREELDVAGYARAAERFLAEVEAQVAPLAALGPVAFFRTAPLDVARHVLAMCRATVEARRQGRNR